MSTHKLIRVIPEDRPERYYIDGKRCTKEAYDSMLAHVSIDDIKVAFDYIRGITRHRSVVHINHLKQNKGRSFQLLRKFSEKTGTRYFIDGVKCSFVEYNRKRGLADRLCNLITKTEYGITSHYTTACFD